MVGQPAHRQDVRRAIKRHGVIEGKTLVGEDLVGDRQQPAVIGLKPVPLGGGPLGIVVCHYRRSYRDGQEFSISETERADSRKKTNIASTDCVTNNVTGATVQSCLQALELSRARTNMNRQFQVGIRLNF
jgi:hypothetical protein